MGRLLRSSAAVIAISSVGLVFTAASPAGATTTHLQVAHHGAIPLGHANSTNANFAGYQTTQTSVTSATDTFKVPTLTGCTATSTDAVGFGVNLANTAGTSFDGGNIFAFCNGTVGAYEIDFYINNNEGDVPLTINPGDKISITITVGATTTTVLVSDTTSGTSVSATDKGKSMQVAQVGAIKLIDSSTGNPLGIPNFGTATHKSKVNGVKLANLTTTAFDMVDTVPQTQITTGAFTPTFTFVNTWVHE